MTGAAGPGGAHALLTEIDHVGIAVRDLDAAIAYYRDTFGATVSHRESIDLDGVEEALIAVADSYIQLLMPDAARLTGGPVPRAQGRGSAPRRIPSRRLRHGAGVRARTGAARSSTKRPGPARGGRRSPSSTPRGPSARSSSWSRSPELTPDVRW